MTVEPSVSVSELNRMIAAAVRREPRLKSVTVRGEISTFKHHLATGHWYFSLKDSEAAISCVMFRTNTLKVSRLPRDGDAMLADGYVDIYPQQGKVQLYVTGLRPAGVGDLYLRLEVLKQKLAAEGLFDQNRKRPLPLAPRKVAVVTSRSGAALHDILNVSGLRSPSTPLVLIPVSVQGAGAGEEIAAGIRLANRTDAEVIIVARGGGSAEDLWCFNDEAVARAVAGSEKPVVSGVGHEVDFTLCDLAADVRASTPSNAAELVFPDRRDLIRRVHLVRSDLIRAQTERMHQAEFFLQTLTNRLAALSPERRISLLKSRTDLMRERLTGAARGCFEEIASRVKAASNALDQSMQLRMKDAEHLTLRLRERLEAVNPISVLDRGYALVYTEDERLLTRASEARKSGSMILQFADGRVSVTGKDET